MYNNHKTRDYIWGRSLFKIQVGSVQSITKLVILNDKRVICKKETEIQYRDQNWPTGLSGCCYSGSWSYLLMQTQIIKKKHVLFCFSRYLFTNYYWTGKGVRRVGNRITTQCGFVSDVSQFKSYWLTTIWMQ